MCQLPRRLLLLSRVLNSKYLPQRSYFNYMDTPEAVVRTDYELVGYDICPVADPNDVSFAMQMVKAQAMMSLKGQGLDDMEINAYFMESIGVDMERFKPKAPPQPPPDFILETKKLEIQERNTPLEAELIKAKILETRAKTILHIANAESKEAGTQIDAYRAKMDDIKAQFDIQDKNIARVTEAAGNERDRELQREQMAGRDMAGKGQGMGGAPGDTGSVPEPGGGEG